MTKKATKKAPGRRRKAEQVKVRPVEPPDPSEPLENVHHELFCHLIIQGMTKERAYIEAGYSRRGASPNSIRLIGNDRVSARLAHLRKTCKRELDLEDERVLNEFKRLAFSNMLDYQKVVGLDISHLTRDQAAAIQELIVTERHDEEGAYTRQVRVKLHAKHPNLDSLCKALGIYEKEERGQEAPLVQILIAR